MNLQICLNALKNELKNYEFESLEVLETSEKLRFFWKPKKVKLMLLAESHVYTTEEENNILQNLEAYKDIFDYENYPKEFVKLIYCLGYGENELLETPLDKNSGTPQFWKIFYNSLNEINDSVAVPILTTNTKNTKERISNKINLLNEMKEKGVWLIDASILALYGNGPKPKDYKKILEVCWNNYIRHLILEEKPEAILIIGKQVYDNLKEHLKTVNIPFDYISQPQARLSKENIQETYKKTFEFAKKYIRENNFTQELIIPVQSTPKSELIKKKIEEISEPVKVGENKSGYKFNEQVYGKSRLVLAVIKKYLEDNSNARFQDLESIFDRKLQGALGVVIKIDNIKDNKRFFLSSEDLITVSNDRVAVCNQWDKNNIDKFIGKARELGYQIEQLN